MRSATPRSRSPGTGIITFNPRAPCGARLLLALLTILARSLSIHALHAERDCSQTKRFGTKKYFQSTRSMRSATFKLYTSPYLAKLSIHALHAERDLRRVTRNSRRLVFQSTRSMRSATLFAELPSDVRKLSIHALHAERD